MKLRHGWANYRAHRMTNVSENKKKELNCLEMYPLPMPNWHKVMWKLSEWVSKWVNACMYVLRMYIFFCKKHICFLVWVRRTRFGKDEMSSGQEWATNAHSIWNLRRQQDSANYDWVELQAIFCILFDFFSTNSKLCRVPEPLVQYMVINKQSSNALLSWATMLQPIRRNSRRKPKELRIQFGFGLAA